ncbi:MAG TPA: ABC transporter substrate-binding protein [Stellaceae bacterium]|jgi:NitT/TauT family transport system substrate-binding protein
MLTTRFRCVPLRHALIVIVTLIMGVTFGTGCAAADEIKIGTVHSQGGASTFVALDKGYFKAEGLDAKLVLFNSAAPIAVAAASGDIDFGSTALTAAFCNLAAKGTLRIIASGSWERPGFQTIGFLVSNQAHAAGLHSFGDMKGHSVGITQLGTPLEYDMARILKKYGIAMSDVKFVPLQSNQNIASAIKGGEIDVGIQTVANITPLVARGDAKLLGWTADELGSGQSTVTFTTGKMAEEHPEIVRRFLAAFAKGGATWDAAFLDANGERKDQPTAKEMIGIVAKTLGEPPEVVARGIGYFDPRNRIVLTDLQEVLDWYHDQGMLKTRMDASSLVDKRFILYAKTAKSAALEK